ncbi:hypothetical protein RND81_14G145400 [Saponaria officinalis]|uniref:Uncharacterized protein n=1 Tax=Saponaria officinalis TaxID=3572 RepID=A0AAW1GQU3_SAPOF
MKASLNEEYNPSTLTNQHINSKTTIQSLCNGVSPPSAVLTVNRHSPATPTRRQLPLADNCHIYLPSPPAPLKPLQSLHPPPFTFSSLFETPFVLTATPSICFSTSATQPYHPFHSAAPVHRSFPLSQTPTQHFLGF